MTAHSSSKPCVLLSSNTSWYLYNYRMNTIRAFRDQGYQIVCLSPVDEYSKLLEAEPGVSHINLGMDNQGNNPVKDVLLLIQFLRCYFSVKPLVVFHFTIKNNLYGTMAAALLGIPAINNISGLGSAFMHGGLVGLVARCLYKISQPFAFRVFCQNGEDFRFLQENKLVPAEKLHKVPGSGVDISRFTPFAEFRNEKPFRFLYIGRMLADKGVRELVAAQIELAHELDTELWLAGFSDAKNVTAISETELQAWDLEHNGIHWLGSTDSPEDLMRNVDCVVLPSYREGLPRSLLEAGAMALPVITTDAAGCREVVEHGKNGLLCMPGDTASLLKAMRNMASKPLQERRQMGLAGRLKVKECFDEKSVIDRYLQALMDASGKIN